MNQKKASMRIHLGELLQNVSSDEYVRAGGLIAYHIAAWLNRNKGILRHQNIASFHNFKDEIDTKALNTLFRELELNLYYPAMNKNGIMQFVADGATLERALGPAELDIIFIPGRAFDRKGRRLGRGQGHYDQALSAIKNIPSCPLFIGLALDNQIVEEVPFEPHDVLMHYICTPKLGVLRTPGE